MPKQHIDSKNIERIEVHNWQKKIESIYNKIESELSKTNAEVIKKYDREMANQGIKKPTRYLHLGKILYVSQSKKRVERHYQ